MQEEHKRKEQRELVKKFEAFLKAKENHYFDEDSFLNIISYYQDQDKLKMALRASDLATGQYPFSTDLIAEKADILVKLNQSDKAISTLETGLAYQPNDPDLLMQVGTIYALTSAYELAIDSFEINFREFRRRYF